MDLMAGYDCIDCTSSRHGIIKQIQKLQSFPILRTGNRLWALYSDTKFFTKQVKQCADADKILKVSFLPSIPNEHDPVRRIERLYWTLIDLADKQLAFKDL